MRGLRRLWYLLRLGRESRDLAEEINLHRAMVEDAQRAAGRSEEEARVAGRRRMGNTTLAREQAREVWLAPWVESVFQDVRYATRSLGSQRSFTVMALLALVLGIGLNTSLFTAVNSILFRTWDVEEPSEVVKFLSRHPRFGFGGFPMAGVSYFNRNSRTIAGAFAERPERLTLDRALGTTVRAHFVSGTYFDVLRVGAAPGRTFADAEDVPEAPVAVAVLSNDLWKKNYAADPAVIGRTIRLDGVPFTVIGVAEESFGGTHEDRTDLWLPLAALTLAQPNDPEHFARLTDPNWCCTGIAARLLPGVTREQAEAELTAQYRQFSTNAQRDDINVILTGTAMLDHPGRRRQAVPVIVLLLAAVGSILLLACANVSNLLLARATARQREIAVRVAIGAGRWRVIRQMLTESLLLAAVASAVSLVISWILPTALMRLMGQEAPTNLHLTPDLNVLFYSIAISAVAALLFGLAPALQSTRVSLNDAMKQTSVITRFRLRRVLLSAQVAISVALLVAAGLFTRSLERARSLDLGFRTDGVTAVHVELPRNIYDAKREQAFFAELLPLLQTAMQPIGMASLMPLGGTRNLSDFMGPGVNPGANPMMPFQDVTAGYFEVLGIPILAGRNFLPEDRPGGAILINETLARQYWPDRSPIGQSVTIGKRSREIIGIVRDSHIQSVGNAGPVYFSVFAPNSRGSGPPVILLPSATAAAAVAAIRGAESGATTVVVPLSEQVERSLEDSKGVARLAGGLGLVALLLATMGVYGVISYSVEQKRREIGVRVALGARRHQVLEFVLRRNSLTIGIGLAAGLLIAAGESMVLKSELYGLSPFDPIAYTGVALLLLFASVLASVIPAIRALRTDAMSALRED